MSTEGTGAVAVGAAVVLGGAAVLAAGAIIGTGMLVAQGVMWCGKKMEENVERARNKWIAQQQAAYAESRANVQDMPLFIAGQAESIAAASANLTLNLPSAPSTAPAAQKQLEASLARLRTALDNVKQITQIKTETDRELLQYRLQSEIEALRGLLPQTEIAQAEMALQGTEVAMRQALTGLQDAWNRVSNTQAIKVHQERRARQILRSVSAQLLALDTLLRSTGKEQISYNKQRQEIETQVEEAQKVVDRDPERALPMAEEAQRAVRTLTHAISMDTTRAWDQTRQRVISIQGTLTTLAQMLQEATAIELLDKQRIQDLSRRIDKTQKESQNLIQSMVPASSDQLRQLDENAARLKAEVFRVVKSRQQRKIAEAVATTLGELGFQSNSGSQPVVQDNGDTVHIVATRSGNTPGFRRDDKVVSFDISREGNLTYDFSGYAGDACVSEAKEIFAAFRAKGIFILDSDAMEKLSRIPAENVSVETLNRVRYNPQIEQNKRQAALAEKLKEVFERMKFANIQESVIGGCIDIEAFNGGIGYHVILPPDGSAEVFKNHVDISANKDDQIVSELSQVEAAKEAPQKARAESKPKAKETWDQYQQSQQQMLDY